MFPFIVLVSKHIWMEVKTTQFDVFVEAGTKDLAREFVRGKYPPVYINRVAYFTGEIFHA